MTIFYLIFVVLAIYFSIRYDGIEEYDSHKQHRLWLMCAYMVCLTGFSYGLGGDKFAYMEEFDLLPSTFSELWNYIFIEFVARSHMPLWTFVIIFCKSVFGSFYALQFLESLAINTVVCYMVSKYTYRYFLFILIYFLSLQYFIFNCEIMREGFAIALVLIGMHRYLSGKKWQFYVFVLAGLMFHISTAFALIFPFVRFRVSWRLLYISIAISFTLWIISDIIMSKVVVYALSGMGSLAQKAIQYSLRSSTLFGFLRTTATYLIFPYIVMYFVTKYELLPKRKNSYEKFTSAMIPLGIIAGSVAGFTRPYNYIMIPYLIMLAEFVFLLFKFDEHLMLKIGTMTGTIYFIILSYLHYYKVTDTYFYEFYYPYTCILDEDEQVYRRKITHIESAGFEFNGKNTRDIE